jgi:TonB family protein
MPTSASIDRDNAPVPPEESLPRRGSNPLLWLLLLLAFLAAIWFFYNRNASNATVDDSPAMPAIAADAQQAAAQAEREQADAATARKAARTQPAASERTQAAKPRIADRGPEPVARMQPKYPAMAYRNREQGSVLVRADVDANGVPGDVAVVRRSGSRELDNAALAAVRQWHFRPAMNNGKAVASAVEVPIDFKLDER